jgi:hypothetical protein
VQDQLTAYEADARAAGLPWAGPGGNVKDT